jgi:hypothetical protein
VADVTDGTRVALDQGGLNDLLRSPAGPLGAALLGGLFVVERRAKHLCPVDTGRLRSSITHEVGIDAGGLVGRVGTDVDYAPYVELGTRRLAPRAFLRGGLSALRGLGR